MGHQSSSSKKTSSKSSSKSHHSSQAQSVAYDPMASWMQNQAMSGPWDGVAEVVGESTYYNYGTQYGYEPSIAATQGSAKAHKSSKHSSHKSSKK